MRVGLLLLTLGILAACGTRAVPSHEDLAYRVEADEDEVVPGRAFGLRVVRAWNKRLVPVAFDPRDLAPLTLLPLSTQRLEDATHVEEIQLFHAYAFALSDVQLKGLAFLAVPRQGGAERRAIAETVEITIRPELEEDDASPPELPEGPLEERSWSWLVLLSALLLSALALLALRRRPTPSPVAATPDALALAALADAKDVRAMADVLRAYVEASLGYDAPRRTTEEVDAAVERGDVPAGGLVELLGMADQVKYAQADATEAEREAVRARATTWIRETAR